jgi:hypothetical protein
MRKFMGVAIAGLAASLALAAPAMAVGPKQLLKASIKPSKIGAKPKKPVGVTFNVNPYFDVNSPAGKAEVDAAPFATKKAHVYFDKNFVFNQKAFKTCAAAIVQSAPDTCPKGSLVGSGSAVGRALGIEQNDLKVRAYNAPNKHFLLRVDGTAVLQIHSVIDGVLKGSTGPYGSELLFTIPPGLQVPQEGVTAALVDFKTSIPAKPTGTKKTSYVTLKGCRKGGLNIGYKGEYTDGTSQRIDTKVPCK